MRALKRDKDIYAIDLLGPLLIRLQRLWNMIPAFRPGIFGGIEEDTYCLAESIDYTLKHDDGQNIDTLPEADLVILRRVPHVQNPHQFVSLVQLQPESRQYTHCS
jgi:regulator of PEP synthase PpsR (kinase-PPPase family)